MMHDILSFALTNHTPQSKMPSPSAADQSVTIGIPRAMAYYQSGRLWENFFTLLGCTVVISQATNHRIMEMGSKICGEAACLPVKAMAGHIASLLGRADTILLPDPILRNETDPCEAAKNLSKQISGRLGRRAELVLFRDNPVSPDFSPLIGKLGVREGTLEAAYLKAARNRRAAEMEAATLEQTYRDPILLVGRAYLTRDSFLNMNILRKLRKRGFDGIIRDGVPREEYGQITGIPGLRGVICITPSYCDHRLAQTGELLAKRTGTPYLMLTIPSDFDEAGFDSKLNAFLDRLDR